MPEGVYNADDIARPDVLEFMAKQVEAKAEGLEVGCECHALCAAQLSRAVEECRRKPGSDGDLDSRWACPGRHLVFPSSVDLKERLLYIRKSMWRAE